ncbi:MAG: polysaccharide biosynthesis/export family protein [Nannocystaceae bacterium]
MAKRFLLPIVFLGFVCSCVTNQTSVPRGTAGIKRAAPRFVPGDVFEVRVFDEEGLSGQFQVQEDGTIEFPLIGRITVEGLSQAEAATSIEDKLEDGLLKNPSVTVIVIERQSVEVSVLGEVAKPGTFPFVERMSLVQAISEAGGLGPVAAPRRVKLIREGPDGPETYQISLEDITAGKAKDVPLEPGDIVFVPESPL